MARKRRVELSAHAKTQLRAKMNQRLGGDTKVSDTKSLQQMIEQYGRKEVNRRYADAAGIRETSARDAITRFLHGKRAPSSRTLDRMGRARRSIQSRELREPGFRPAITATYRISATEWMGRAQARDLDAAQRAALADAYEADDMDRVADIITRGYGKHFHDNLSNIDDIEDFEID
jgi:hypothetical protein